jgi:hypothetical protein
VVDVRNDREVSEVLAGLIHGNRAS